jgi:glycosyltransferase involved in cell wall biosynthesis
MRLFHNISFVREARLLSHLFEYCYVIKSYKFDRYILSNIDLILPNSHEEGEILKQKYKSKAKEFDIPNCIDLHIDDLAQGNGIPLSNDIPENCVLQVGRIEPTKNQLSLLQAMMKHSDIPLVFVGKQNKRKQYYIDQLKKLASKRGNTFFIEELSQEQLIPYYRSAKVHALPSFRESPGLVSLEALYYHCNIVVSESKYCPINYYKFDKLGYICNPYSVASIEKAVMQAYNNRPITISDDYFTFFNYQNAAKLTRDAYLLTLNQIQ